jgi:hypothetical protein
MSVLNTKGYAFAILNEKGYYDLYDATGEKLEMRVSTMRVTMNAGEVDKIVIIAPVNILRNKEEMQKVINQ